ncbi:MAG TPA: gas vesicle protein [Blastocatellia bacterium]|nr:gas vesicle protein [Blastocatellia bacterium]
MTDQRIEQLDLEDELSLLETLDHVLNRGLVIAGEITISVADIDLIFVGLNLLLGSVETIGQVLDERKAKGRQQAITGGDTQGM